MQHPLTGATCVALPNVGMCPQLSCALTFMYLQQKERRYVWWSCSEQGEAQHPVDWVLLCLTPMEKRHCALLLESQDMLMQNSIGFNMFKKESPYGKHEEIPTQNSKPR
ncbi:hypothetical protein STEG23_004135 [Scotinomys teguina]